MKRLMTLLRDPRGATAVEYGLILALVVLVMLTGLSVLADATTSMWNNSTNRVKSVVPGG